MATQVEYLPYRLSLRTCRDPDSVLAELSAHEVAGVGAREYGAHYVLLSDRRPPRYGPDLAVGLGIAILLVILIGYAFVPVAIALLPLAAAPALPLLIESEHTVIAVSAISEPDGATRLTAHGQVKPELAAALDDYFGALPTPDEVEEPEYAGASPGPGTAHLYN